MNRSSIVVWSTAVVPGTWHQMGTNIIPGIILNINTRSIIFATPNRFETDYGSSRCGSCVAEPAAQLL